MRLSFALVLSVGCAACVHVPTMESEGLTTEILFRLEAEEWGPNQTFPDAEALWSTMAGYKKLPLSARPVRIRNVKCRWESTFKTFECSYDVDWKSAEGATGTYTRQKVNLGKENGVWTNDTIVLS